MNYKLVRDDLGYYRCDPIPSEVELKDLYEKEFYTSTKPDYIQNQEDDIRWWNAMYDDRLTIMSEVYRKSSKDIYPLMLDVGCGGGFFLRRAFEYRLNQWLGVGVEPNYVALEYAKNKSRYFGGMTFYEHSLDNVKETRFWGAHMSEVLEHMRNPLSALKEIYDRLLPGGVICVVVPNEKFVEHHHSLFTDGGMVGCSKKVLLYPHVFQPPQHINYFTFDSLEAIMKEAGFEIYERSAMYPMELFLTQGIDYVNRPELGVVAHQMRKNFDLSMTSEERRVFYRKIAKNNLGRECVMYGVKR